MLRTHSATVATHSSSDTPAARLKRGRFTRGVYSNPCLLAPPTSPRHRESDVVPYLPAPSPRIKRGPLSSCGPLSSRLRCRLLILRLGQLDRGGQPPGTV